MQKTLRAVSACLLIASGAALMPDTAIAQTTATPQPFDRGAVDGPWATRAPVLTRWEGADLLAQAGAGTAPRAADGQAAPATRPAQAREPVDAPMFGASNIHKYLGLGSLGAVALTAISPKTNGGAHENFARASFALGAAAVVTGLISHWDDLEFSWRDPDTRHAMLGGLGVLAFALAVKRGGESGHAAAGEVGALAMLTAIKLTW